MVITHALLLNPDLYTVILEEQCAVVCAPRTWLCVILEEQCAVDGLLRDTRPGGTGRVMTRPKFGPTNFFLGQIEKRALASSLAVPDSHGRTLAPPVRVWHRETSVKYALPHDM